MFSDPTLYKKGLRADAHIFQDCLLGLATLTLAETYDLDLDWRLSRHAYFDKR